MRVVLLTDTHLADGAARSLDERVLDEVAASDLVLHAGDVTGAELLAHLGALAPVRAVLGNNDVTLRERLPEQVRLDLDGLDVGMVHDAGPRSARPARLARRFPGADLVVFGHSHEPEDTAVAGCPRIFNPGSPTQRRRAPTRTFGLLDVEAGRIVDLHHVVLD
jgi:uncharacterized protein